MMVVARGNMYVQKRWILIVFLLLCANLASSRSLKKDSNPILYNSDSIHSVIQPPLEEVKNDILLPKRTNFKNKKEALEIIEKVVKHKNDYQIYNQEYANYDVYDKLMFTWNNFNPNKKFLHRWPVFSEYADTSTISQRSILPLAMYESYSTHYFRKNPQSEQQVVHGRTIYGITDELHAEDGCEDLVKILEGIDIRKNDFRVFFNKIASPLAKNYATSLYRWEIMDTTTIQGKSYIVLCFRPSSIMDLGFVGNIYVATDGSYAIKRVVMKITKSMNLNYVEEFVIYQNFEELLPGIWVLSRSSTTCKMSFFNIIRSYYEFGRSYNNFQFAKAPDSVYKAPHIVYQKDYLKKGPEFWETKRAITSTKHNNEYCSDTIVNTFMKIPFIKFSINTINILTNNYVPLSNDAKKNKISFGTFDTFYSANSIEGSRVRLSAVTTANLHPHLFFSGYGAYGFKDRTFKYSTATTWAFNKPHQYPQEFPQNNLTLSYEYDLNTLGENYLYVKRDNIIMSLLRYRELQRMTYAHRLQVAYNKEYINGFSFEVLLKSQEEIPAGELKFVAMDESGLQKEIKNIQTTEVTSIIRYATNERFFIRINQRTQIPDERSVISLTHTVGLKNVLQGQYRYNKTQFHVIKDFWLASFGQLKTSFKLEKVWGTLSYPLLISPNANNSYTIQNESFALISPLEFVNDQQMSWETDYHFKGWICRNIPYIKRLGLREIIGINGFVGSLNARNNPFLNHSLFMLPENAQTMKKDPYMELSMGLSNIFRVFRVDYVRRLTYLNEPNTKKDGFRISARIHF